MPLPGGYEAEAWRLVRKALGPERQPEQLFTGKGCPACAHSGYQGRSGIYEFLVVDDAIRPLILQRADASTMRQEAVAQGMETMAANGWHKVAQGLTTAGEVSIVTQE
jgi:general secretion pathway protein E